MNRLKIEAPILQADVYNQLNEFLRERQLIDKFLEQDIIPPNSILLYGKPGVGKTYIAKWLSYMLNMPLVTLDLASAISSYLEEADRISKVCLSSLNLKMLYCFWMK